MEKSSSQVSHSSYKGSLLPENLSARMDPQLAQNLEKLDSSFFYTTATIKNPAIKYPKKNPKKTKKPLKNQVF